MLPKAGYREQLTTALGRPLRFCRDSPRRSRADRFSSHPTNEDP
jgi:hypothetical protein